MKVLVVGSGGREHALVWKISQSPMVDKIYCAPGNAGIGEMAECVAIKAEDLDGLLDFAVQNEIGLTVVGPEVPLTMGIVDKFQEKGLKIFGPSGRAAEIEGSKTFAKDLMAKYGIPTAKYGAFTDAAEAKAFLAEVGLPCVVKADGLAAGKGVLICETKEEAETAVEDILVDNKFGNAGSRVVVEEFLTGQEVSMLELELARDLDLPVIIHDRDAHADVLDMIKKYRPRGIVHCFSGSKEMASELVKLGMYIGFTGVLTFSNARRALEAVDVIPIDRLVLETDCPYMAPVPFRGRRCDSRLIVHHAEVMARIKGVDTQKMIDIANENGRRIYGIEL